MKKIISILSVVAAVFVVASCASKTVPDQPTVQPVQTHTHVHHHDYKGETK